MATTLSAANFDAFVGAETLTVVDFWASWCGPCKMIAPVLDEIVAETGLALGKVNVDDEPALSTRFSIDFIPTLVLFKGGKELERTSGFHSKADVLALVAKHS